MKPHTLLLWSDAEADLAFVSAVGEVFGAKVSVLPMMQGVLEQAKADAGVWVFANVGTDERLASFNAARSAAVEPNRIHLIGSPEVAGFDEICVDACFGHFILPGKGDSGQVGTHYGKVLKKFMEAGGATGAVSAEPSFEVKLQRSSDRAKVIKSLEEYLTDKLEINPRVRGVMVNAVDELLMNAIFDAPRDSAGTQLFKNTPRTQDFPLSGKSQVELELRNDGEYLAFTSTDFFGTLDRTHLFRKLFRSFKEDAYVVDSSEQNAGLGLATTFEFGGSLLFFSQSKVKTRVSVIFRNSNSYREVVSQFRYLSVHLSDCP